MDKLGVILRVNPGNTDPHVDLRCGEVFGLGLLQCGHILCKYRFNLCRRPCSGQLLPDIAG